MLETLQFLEAICFREDYELLEKQYKVKTLLNFKKERILLMCVSLEIYAKFSGPRNRISCQKKKTLSFPLLTSMEKKT